MFGKIIILGAEVLVYYKSAAVMYKIAKSSFKLLNLMFNKNKPEEDVIETQFAD